MRLRLLLLLAVFGFGLNAHAAKKYTAIGDSVSVGLFADAAPLPDGTYEHAFTAQVRDVLIATRGYGLSDYHNRAISNATTSNAFTRPGESDGIVENQLAAAIADNPDLITLTVGGNDVKNFAFAAGSAQTPGNVATFTVAFQSGLNTILTQLRAGAPNRFIFLTNVPKIWLLPAVYGHPAFPGPTDADKQMQAQAYLGGYVTAANSAITTEAASANATVIDLFGDSGVTDASNIAFDGFHPNRAGHDGLKDKFLAAMTAVPEVPSLVVTTTSDTSANDGDTTLREAISYANSLAGDDTVTFSNGDGGTANFHDATPETIQLPSALPDLSTNIIITGPGANKLTVQRSTAGGTPQFRIFNVLSGATAGITGLTLGNGSGTTGSGIENRGTLNLSNSILTNNSATLFGGGISNHGTLNLSNSTLNNNSVPNSGGGGITNLGTGLSNISNSTISNNSANSGGGIENLGSMAVQNCTISGNSSAHNGGGIYNGGQLTVQNSTISGNRADSDGNGSGSGGGISAAATETLDNTIVAGNLSGTNSTPDDINGGTINTASSNLIGDAATSGGITNATDGNIVGINGSGARAVATILNPTLADNGGLTQTFALVPGSLAINQGNSNLATDQRGIARPQGGASDIGAYEAVLLEIADQSITEGDSGTTNITFTVTLSAALEVPVNVNYATANGSAKSGSDFNNSLSDSDGASPGTLTIPAGQTTGSISVPIIGDTVNEASEVFYVLLSSPVNAIAGKGRGIAIVTDNDSTPPALSITDVTISEGNSGTRNANFTLSLSAASGQVVSVDVASANGTATAGSDYTALSTTISFSPGQTQRTVTVALTGDTLNEANETFFVNLSNAQNATIADNQGVGTISNDDRAPSLSISDASITEGNSGTTTLTFTVTLSAASGQNVSVGYGTQPGSAKAGTDYVTSTGTLTFAAGVTTQTINITINGDTLVELNEGLYVVLTSPSNASLGRGRAVGTITNDDTSG